MYRFGKPAWFKRFFKKLPVNFLRFVNQGYLGPGLNTGLIFFKMKRTNRKKGIYKWAGYIVGLFIGLAVMITFSVSMGTTFYGILLGISFSLGIGIAFE